MSNKFLSDDGPGSNLFDPHITGSWKSPPEDHPVTPDQPCSKCNGEGYVVIRVYPWDGCSYDEIPCDLCNPAIEDFDFA